MGAEEDKTKRNVGRRVVPRGGGAVPRGVRGGRPAVWRGGRPPGWRGGPEGEGAVPWGRRGRRGRSRGRGEGSGPERAVRTTQTHTPTHQHTHVCFVPMSLFPTCLFFSSRVSVFFVPTAICLFCPVCFFFFFFHPVVFFFVPQANGPQPKLGLFFFWTMKVEILLITSNCQITTPILHGAIPAPPRSLEAPGHLLHWDRRLAERKQMLALHPTSIATLVQRVVAESSLQASA